MRISFSFNELRDTIEITQYWVPKYEIARFLGIISCINK